MSVRSYDFWDTLVTRLVLQPVDIFRLVEGITRVHGFAGERVAAETRSRVGVSETTIDRIYEQLPYDSVTRARLQALELELEFSLASRIGETAIQFRYDDIVISDMYLPRTQITRIATACGIRVQEERVFVSGELAKTKSAGALFEHTKDMYQIESHTGDNAHSDVHMAIKADLAAIHFKGCELNTLEKQWAEDGAEAYYVAGILRAARLEGAVTESNGRVEWQLFSQIVAPALVAFIDWVVTQCVSKGISKVFFLSRDGQILNRIADEQCKQQGLKLECKYIYGSRQALHLPGHENIDKSESWILDDTKLLTLETLAARTCIPVPVVQKIAEKYLTVAPGENLQRAQRSALRKAIRDPDFLIALEDASAESLEVAADYYRGVGLLSHGSEKVAVVDVGWNGRIQRSLEGIAAKIGICTETLDGFYFALSKQCVYTSGERVHGFVSDPFVDAPSNLWVDQQRPMIELFLSGDHPSVLGFKRTKTAIEPIFAPPLSDAWVAHVRRRQQAILAFAVRREKFQQLTGLRVGLSSTKAIAMLKRFLLMPTKEEAAVFVNCRISEDQVEKNYVGMISRLTILDVFRRSRQNRLGLWIEGSCAWSGVSWAWRVRRFAKAIRIIVHKCQKLCWS